MAFDPNTGLVYVPAREGSPALHVPDKGWTYNPKFWNRGEDAAYDGPLQAKLLSSPPMTGQLIAWNPVEQREAWRASLPLVESGGVLATATRWWLSDPGAELRPNRAPRLRQPLR